MPQKIDLLPITKAFKTAPSPEVLQKNSQKTYKNIPVQWTNNVLST